MHIQSGFSIQSSQQEDTDNFLNSLIQQHQNTAIGGNHPNFDSYSNNENNGSERNNYYGYNNENNGSNNNILESNITP
jgi:hypothetical protein